MKSAEPVSILQPAEPLSSPDDPRVQQAVQEYLVLIEAGRKPARAEFLAQHAPIAAALDEYLDGLDFVHAVARDLTGTGQGAGARSDGMEFPAPLGDFRIIREVGRGGMGVVYEAEQMSLGRRVALKVLPFAATMDPRQLQRFKNEAHAAAQLHHTNIVPVYAVGCERSVHYYAMQFISGHTVATLINELRGTAKLHTPGVEPTGPYLPDSSPVTPPVAGLSTERPIRSPVHFLMMARLGVQAAEALEHAHQLGVVHRDIKPANLLVEGELGASASSIRLWVTDFGLAHCQNQVGLTMSGDLLGTLRYMSPEQALGQRPALDHRTDIYSLGVTLYELLTLEPAFSGSDRQELLHRIGFEEPAAPRRLNRAIPAELETIVLKMMEKSPADRYATAQEVVDDLRRFLEDQPIRARRPSFVARVRKWSRRHRAVVTTAIVTTLLALGISSGLIARQWYLADQRRIQAEGAEQRARKAEGVTRAINQFLIKDILIAATPEEAQGTKVTVEDVLDRAALKIETAFPNEPEEEAAVRMAIGSAYNSLGLNAKAEPHFQRALAIREQLLGSEHKDTLETLVAIGTTWIQQGKYAEGEKLDRQTLETVRRVLGDEHILALELEHFIAWVVMSRGRWDEAEALLRQCLRKKTKILGEEDLDTVETMESLAFLLGERLGKWQEAEPLARRCLKIRERRLGKNHPQSTDTQNELAEILKSQGKWKEAEVLFRETFQRARAVSPKHERTATFEHNLALMLYLLNRLDEAEAAFRDCLQLRSSPEHPEALTSRMFLAHVLLARGELTVAEQQFRELLAVIGRLQAPADFYAPVIRGGLGVVFQEQGKWAEAEDTLRQALTGLRRALPGHFWTPHTATRLAVLLDAVGNHAEAATLFRDALAVWRKSFPIDHPERAFTLCAWGEHLLAVGDLGQAELTLAEALRIERTALPPEHRGLGQTLCALGWLRAQTGQAQEAEKLLREGLTVCRQAWPVGHWVPADAESRLGGCLTALEQYDEAEKLLLNSYGSLDKSRGTPPLRCVEAADRVIKLYEAWSKPGQAAQWRAKRAALPTPQETGSAPRSKNK
jgi:serine/threonine protein kinase/tetratricopeptide (TPR) repeat protein